MGDLPPDLQTAYPSQLPQPSTDAIPPITLHLENLPSSFSLSEYLSPQSPFPYQFQQAISTPGLVSTTQSSQRPFASHARTPSQTKEKYLHPTQLIALALNEECRIWGYGRVFYLPLPVPTETASRRGPRLGGHPTDLVYITSIWSERMNVEWDGGSWEDRLRDCAIGE